VRDFTELKVWQKSHSLTLEIYRVSAAFPRDEIYGLTSQIRRSCSSIPSNISEGCGREGVGELARFLNIAMGSASELQYQVMLARDLGFVDPDTGSDLLTKVVEVKRMLGAYIARINEEKQNRASHVHNSRPIAPRISSNENSNPDL
jgi:four helix bundle protein